MQEKETKLDGLPAVLQAGGGKSSPAWEQPGWWQALLHSKASVSMFKPGARRQSPAPGPPWPAWRRPPPHPEHPRPCSLWPAPSQGPHGPAEVGTDSAAHEASWKRCTVGRSRMAQSASVPGRAAVQAVGSRHVQVRVTQPASSAACSTLTFFTPAIFSRTSCTLELQGQGGWAGRAIGAVRHKQGTLGRCSDRIVCVPSDSSP